MPFQSEAQRGWMFAHHPEMAKEWQAHTPPGKLPEHVSKDAAGQPLFSPNQEHSAADRFMQKFQDPRQWKEVKGVPYFDEHEESRWEPEQDANGQPIMDPATGKPKMRRAIEKFGLAELQEHADRCNRMVAQGKPIGLTLGHTKDQAPEEEQPRTVGYAHNFRVGYSALLGRNVIFGDERFDPAHYSEVVSFPFRSVERWKSGRYFAPIALLRREPARNLGVVAYHGRRLEGTEAILDTVVRYSMGEHAAMPDLANIPPAAAPAAGMPPANSPMPPAMPPAAPAGGDRSKADMDKFSQYAGQHPILGHMLKHYGKLCMAAGIPAPEGLDANRMPTEGQEAPLPPEIPKPMAAGIAGRMPMGATGAPAGGMGSSPSGTNTALPEWQGGGQQRMQADTNPEVVRYMQAQDERIREQEERIAQLEQGERVARYSRDIIRMQQEGYPITEEKAVEILTRCQDYSADQWNGYLADMKDWMGDRRIATGGPVRMQASGQPIMNGPNGQPQRLSKAQMDYALKYQRENPQVTQTQAFELARQAIGWAPDPPREGERPIY